MLSKKIRLIQEDTIESDFEISKVAVLLTLNNEPECYKEAITCQVAQAWIKAISDEYNSLISNETWELVEQPIGFNIVKNKWVFKIQLNVDGGKQFKARLVAKGLIK